MKIAIWPVKIKIHIKQLKS